MADRTFATMVVGLFAFAGISVVGVGLFAMVAFIVARRTREIAIRAAIGAGVSTPAENLTDPPIENLTDRRGDEPQVVVAS